LSKDGPSFVHTKRSNRAQHDITQNSNRFSHFDVQESNNQYFTVMPKNKPDTGDMKYLTIFILIIFFLPTLFCAQSVSVSNAPLSVCEVLHNSSKYAGKIIQIRGEWHGSWVEDKCDKQIQTENHKWPNMIHLAYTQSLGKNDAPVEWVFGPYDYDPLVNRAMRLISPVYATITGRLEVRTLLIPSPNGGLPGTGGYGHQSALPARIVIKEIKDIVGQGLRENVPEISNRDD
jgi:hypothetical protein